jgi:hypothetical protein
VLWTSTDATKGKENDNKKTRNEQSAISLSRSVNKWLGYSFSPHLAAQKMLQPHLAAQKMLQPHLAAEKMLQPHLAAQKMLQLRNSLSDFDEVKTVLQVRRFPFIPCKDILKL